MTSTYSIKQARVFYTRATLSLPSYPTMSTMKAIGVSTYGSVDKLESRDVPRPAAPTGRDVLVQ